MGYMTGNTSLTCGCGRTFPQHNALNNHQRTCQSTARRISGALIKFKALLDGRKRRRLEDEATRGDHEAGTDPGSSSRQEEVRFDQTSRTSPNAIYFRILVLWTPQLILICNRYLPYHSIVQNFLTSVRLPAK